MTTVVRYVAIHSFQGNDGASQLSFSKGEVIVCDTTNHQNQGWVWCTIPRTSKCGWCPLSYLGPAEGPKEPAPPPPSSVQPERVPWYADSDSSNNNNNNNINYGNPQDNDDGGFGGSIMGGTIPTPQAANTGGNSYNNYPSSSSSSSSNYNSQQQQQQQQTTQLTNRLSQIGSSIQTAGKNSWAAVSNGAQKAGQYTKNAMAGTPKTAGSAGTTNQQPAWLRGGTQQKQQPTTNKKKNNSGSKLPWQQRTQGEQKAIDVGNYAARGAVVGAARNVVFNPSIGGLARGITRGAVTGGAWGAVKDWKPFG